MGTAPTEWRALPFVLAEDEETRKIVPQVDWSAAKGYAPAPTLYPSSSGSECCELCATKIKNVYGVINEKRRWVLLVGSECVTHFEGVSGKEMGQEALEVMAALALERLLRLYDVVQRNMSAHQSLYFINRKSLYPIAQSGKKTKQRLSVWYNKYRDGIDAIYDKMVKLGPEIMRNLNTRDQEKFREFL